MSVRVTDEKLAELAERAMPGLPMHDIVADLQDARAEIARLKNQNEVPLQSFATGDRVKHKSDGYGFGTVIEMSKSGKKVCVRWDSPKWYSGGYSSYVYVTSVSKASES